ncbi:hypothetical protein VIBHAR_07126 [Vibrio campbellii ATCC BAA-1116]|uniref:Uncharacterized protein n=1 Tax=Vibrio campbellii (strain ATCC BAA-1116) TaxID=2902295 RepID=A7N7K8_VIBC1|nr:hypothetical protein VIBHAR_07126 [Vibrio campbellii ATCC BAA-1116]
MPTSNHLEKCRKFAFFIFIKFLGSALEFGIWNLEFGIILKEFRIKTI